MGQFDYLMLNIFRNDNARYRQDGTTIFIKKFKFQALIDGGIDSTYLEIPDMDHFSITEELRKSDYSLTKVRKWSVIFIIHTHTRKIKFFKSYFITGIVQLLNPAHCAYG